MMVKSMIDNIYQTFDNNEVYKSIEDYIHDKKEDETINNIKEIRE